MLKLIIITVVLALAACCRDRVHNVINLRDCGGRDALIRFRNLKAFTYDIRKRPKCFGREANVGLPGFLSFSSGQIIVNRDLGLKRNPADMLLTLEKNDILINKVCRKGIRSNIALRRDGCRANLCSTFGPSMCALIDKKGNHNLDRQPKNWHSPIKIDVTNPVAKLLLKGQWKGELHIQQRGKVIGCIAAPANIRGWTRVDQ